MNYLIEYNADYECKIIDAENIEDCIIQFAVYMGDNTDLFLKALRGCETVNDYIDMYNHFSGDTIYAIHIIKETLYDAT